MASVNSITLHGVLSLSTPKTKPTVKGLSGSSLRSFRPSLTQIFSRTKQREWVVVGSVSKELDVIPVQSSDSTDQQDGVVNRTEREIEGEEIVNQVVVGGFGKEGRLSFEGAGEIQGFSSSASSSVGIEGKSKEEEFKHLIDRAINAAIVLAAGTFAINKLLTIDQDYWHVSIGIEFLLSCVCYLKFCISSLCFLFCFSWAFVDALLRKSPSCFFFFFLIFFCFLFL
ncbi:hypothetical protein CsSME_00026392 [Camellia sinensis var. sinensis]